MYPNWKTYGPYVIALMFVWLKIMHILLKHLTNDRCVKHLCIFKMFHTQALQPTAGQNYLELGAYVKGPFPTCGCVLSIIGYMIT